MTDLQTLTARRRLLSSKGVRRVGVREITFIFPMDVKGSKWRIAFTKAQLRKVDTLINQVRNLMAGWSRILVKEVLE